MVSELSPFNKLLIGNTMIVAIINPMNAPAAPNIISLPLNGPILFLLSQLTS